MVLYCAADDAALAQGIAAPITTPITVQVDDALSIGDMRVEWEGGGLELSLSHALNALHQIINAHQPPTTHKE
jgi:flagellar biosynthesis/type III secretory pathway protein FliH